MDVRLFPSSRRPGVGLKPRREAQRPLLPQHARHCPVLEAGSALGFLVYPPLEANESFHIAYEGEGRYRFVYYLRNPNFGRWDAIFTITIALPVGGYGVSKEEVTFEPGMPTTPTDVALHLMRRFVAVEDLGTPAGSVTLRGAWNFRTPSGWDTVYAPIFNVIERPIAPMLVIRVETDWFAHESEFRYVLQPGEGMSGEQSMPIGQVFFVPREQVTLSECSEEEVAAIRLSQAEFAHKKAAQKVTTPYGLPYSPHYSRMSRKQRQAPGHSDEEPSPVTESESGPAESGMATGVQPHGAATDAPSGFSVRAVGRNEPCPCGSGKKYRKCHGETDGSK